MAARRVDIPKNEFELQVLPFLGQGLTHIPASAAEFSVVHELLGGRLGTLAGIKRVQKAVVVGRKKAWPETRNPGFPPRYGHPESHRASAIGSKG